MLIVHPRKKIQVQLLFHISSFSSFLSFIPFHFCTFLFHQSPFLSFMIAKKTKGKHRKGWRLGSKFLVPTSWPQTFYSTWTSSTLQNNYFMSNMMPNNGPKVFNIFHYWPQDYLALTHSLKIPYNIVQFIIYDGYNPRWGTFPK
jgi:hypothetical protein